ncbi:hypothetical protein [Salinigranum halophilum]|uniref:hypothetical protein n=1 Tax=Salinigranum halophilum TaxID=2565931 RepID=UPI0010A79254|nr:hypothetical protein [Salinigranum halophilum]
MSDPTDRNAVLAATFERIASDLRDGSATVYGYDVRLEPRPRERGGVSYTEGWLSFELVGPAERE